MSMYLVHIGVGLGVYDFLSYCKEEPPRWTKLGVACVVNGRGAEASCSPEDSLRGFHWQRG